MKFPISPKRKKQDIAAEQTKTDLFEKIDKARKATQRVNRILENNGITLKIYAAKGGYSHDR